MNDIQKTATEKLSLLKNRKILLGTIALLMGLAVIFLFSLVPYTITDEHIKSMEFLTDLLIICAITILAMVCVIFIGQASNAQNPKSKLAKATVRFTVSKDKVVTKGLHRFKCWIKQVLVPNDIKAIKERLMNSVGIEDYTVLKLNIPEIKELLKGPQIFNNVAYSALTEKQVKLLIHIKENGIDLVNVPPEYYLTVKNLLDDRTRSERAANEGKKKSVTVITSIGSKLILTIVMFVIFALFVKDTSEGGPGAAEAWGKLITRLWCFFTSAFMGYLVGCQINDIDAEYIEMRVDVHTEYLEDELFTCLDVKEQAKQDFKDRMLEEQRTPMLPGPSDN